MRHSSKTMQENNGREKSKGQLQMVVVTMSHASDSAKDGLKQGIDVTNEEESPAIKPNSVENVAVGEDGTVKRPKSVARMSI
ncbi:hypothetical protein Bca4012_022966 [Brassica carinata]